MGHHIYIVTQWVRISMRTLTLDICVTMQTVCSYDSHDYISLQSGDRRSRKWAIYTLVEFFKTLRCVSDTIKNKIRKIELIIQCNGKLENIQDGHHEYPKKKLYCFFSIGVLSLSLAKEKKTFWVRPSVRQLRSFGARLWETFEFAGRKNEGFFLYAIGKKRCSYLVSMWSPLRRLHPNVERERETSEFHHAIESERFAPLPMIAPPDFRRPLNCVDIVRLFLFPWTTTER